MSENNSNSDKTPDLEAKVIPADNSLKEKIGKDVDMQQVFAQDIIDKAQQSIDSGVTRKSTNPASKNSPLAKIKVVIADEDQKMASIVRDILEAVGFIDISLAKNGEEVVKIIDAATIDILITDWRMSPMDGISLIRHIRALENSANRFIPIIMLTTNVERIQVETARDSGATEFIIKPFNAKNICDRIMLLIEQPRKFIVSKNYVGHDRRRRNMMPPDNIERRKNK